VRKIHLFLTNVTVKSSIYAQAFYMTVIYSSDLLRYNAKYFQTLSSEKCQSLANSLHSTLKLRSTLHKVAWQYDNLAYSSFLQLL